MAERERKTRERVSAKTVKKGAMEVHRCLQLLVRHLLYLSREMTGPRMYMSFRWLTRHLSLKMEKRSNSVWQQCSVTPWKLLEISPSNLLAKYDNRTRLRISKLISLSLQSVVFMSDWPLNCLFTHYQTSQEKEPVRQQQSVSQCVDDSLDTRTAKS